LLILKEKENILPIQNIIEFFFMLKNNIKKYSTLKNMIIVTIIFI
jgi:hypothetical protein